MPHSATTPASSAFTEPERAATPIIVTATAPVPAHAQAPVSVPAQPVPAPAPAALPNVPDQFDNANDPDEPTPEAIVVPLTTPKGASIGRKSSLEILK